MARVSLDLENAADLSLLNADGWRVAMGLVPGEPNQGLTAEMRESPARLPDYDDSSGGSRMPTFRNAAPSASPSLGTGSG